MTAIVFWLCFFCSCPTGQQVNRSNNFLFKHRNIYHNSCGWCTRQLIIETFILYFNSKQWMPHAFMHTSRTTLWKDKIWQEILFGRPVGLVSNRPTELSAGQFNASPIGFLNRKFDLLVNWGSYKGEISTPTGQYAIQMVCSSVAGSSSGLQSHTLRLWFVALNSNRPIEKNKILLFHIYPDFVYFFLICQSATAH